MFANLRRDGLIGVLVLCTLALISPAWGQALRLGIQGDASIDPHFLFLDSNVSVNKHIFSALTEMDPETRVVPDLAASWRAIDDKTWEFDLRPDARFHDGAPVEAEDVLASVRRVRNLPNNPGPYTPNLQAVVRVEAVANSRVRFHTDRANPLLPAQLANILIIPRRFETASTAEFRSGQAAIGSGPFRIVSFTPGDRVELARNDAYFRTKPHWERVTIRFIPNDTTRVAALLAGDVDVIDFVPVSSAQLLKNNPQVSLYTGPSLRIMFVQFDVARSSTPGVTDAAGQSLERNPFQDLRVRQALSLAVNRQGLVERIMEGFGVPTSQFAIPSLLGFDPGTPFETSDPERARGLLRAAGYPNGFGLTLNCPNNRYPNDAKICEAVGQMFARAGLQMRVETQPMNVFFPRLSRAGGPEVSAWLLGLGSSQGEPSAAWLIFRTPQRELGRGQFNFGGFSDPELDRLIDDAVSTVDREARGAKLQAVMRRGTELHATLPLFGLSVIVATRRGLTYPTATNEHTLAARVRPTP